MLIRLLVALFIFASVAVGGWYFWSDIHPFLGHYKDDIGAIASLLAIAIAAITLLAWVFKPRQLSYKQQIQKEQPSVPLFNAEGDVVIGDKQETHYHGNHK